MDVSVHESEMVEVCNFFVPGIPEPAGSKKSFVPLDKRLANDDWPRGMPYKDANGRVIVNTVDANPKAKAWKEVVSTFARFAYGSNKGLLDGAVSVEFTFVMPRPKGHFGTGRNAGIVKEKSPLFHTVRPDVLKLSRAVEDALTDVIWTDDCRIPVERLVKIYGDKPGVQVRVLKQREAS